MQCHEFINLMPHYLDDSLDEAQRRLWRQHLRSCAECRTRALNEDPSLLLSMSAPASVDRLRVDACVANVGALIRQESLKQRIHRPTKWWVAAAAAVLLMISAGVFRATAPGSTPLLASTDATSTAKPAKTTPEKVQPPRMDLDMTRDGLRMYQFAGSGDENSAAYFIVDENLEL